ncbi:MAG: Asp23/Gls24 family envelope stress response protein [Chloroflexi bacterium]|nr:Asp23/Gls24 family envelope stress response protein [Chloroflexota bacterium]
MTEDTTPGTTTVSPDVLVAIARLEALKVPGVYDLAPVPGGVNRLFRKGANEGVQIEIADGVVDADLYVVLESSVNLRRVSREIQKAVARAISEMVGMTVGRINVHIEDIHYPQG